ncbi:eCIS core domain-containing protein [Variovorax sp. IB41]|uniref:eCIS core domain-containing protein n=1 Tax=Variovorax sp. IB41 TaxID=2779370 RepID=UPI0018E75F96|nr:DUF4157 domain-containing protein [Variovorax sp. IB41]MBJ2158000.1 DUF4157 domain-containing protein [Variovorax sp. IB41]
MADTATQVSPTRAALRVPDTRRPPPRRVPPATSKPAAAVTPIRVSQPSDPAEREAVRVSQRVLAMAPAAATPQARRFAKTVPARGSARSLLPSSLGVGASVGQPLPRHLKHDMEPRFGADFSAVRVHTGDAAARASRRLNAAAFTVGHEVFFGRGRFAPGSVEGRGLIAHELTHTIQQGGAAQPSANSAVAHRSVDTTVRVRSEPQVQRLGVQDALDYFAGKADSIPGFSMFALVLGMNPINGRAVDRSPANVFRALVRFVPGGDLIVRALDTYGVFDKIANWFSQQVDSLGMVGASFKQAVYDYADSLGPGALLDLGGAWDRAVRIFTTPWNQVKTFVGGLAGDILTLIKDAVLKPLAALAATTPAYPLLKAVLGRDPVTGDESPGDAQAILGGIMTLAGQGEVWGRVQSTGAIGRVVAWFNDAKKALVGFVKQVPALAMAAFTSLELMDIVLLPRGLAKVAAVFGNFVASFIGWGVDSAMKLAEIVFEVVSPGAWGTIQKTGSALKNIIKDPLPFVSNLGKAAKLGFQNFAGNFLTHLQNGLIKWLTGSLSGVYIPTALSLPEIVKFAFSVLGLSWGNLRGKLVKGIGETAVVALEKGFGIVMTLKDKGPAAAWEQVKAELAALKDQVIEGIKGMIIEAVVTKAIPKLVAMFIPGAGFISAIVSIYDMVMVFVNKISEIAAVVSAFVGSISAIASGAIGAAAGKVESVLAGGLSLAINFLAGFAGLGKIAAKINGILQKIRAPVDKALDSMVAWVRKMAKKFLDALLGKKDKDGKPAKPPQAQLDAAVRATEAVVDENPSLEGTSGKFAAIKSQYGLKRLDVRKQSETEISIDAELNPKKHEVRKLSPKQRLKDCIKRGLHGKKVRMQGSGNPKRAAEQAVIKLRQLRAKQTKIAADLRSADVRLVAQERLARARGVPEADIPGLTAKLRDALARAKAQMQGVEAGITGIEHEETVAKKEKPDMRNMIVICDHCENVIQEFDMIKDKTVLEAKITVDAVKVEQIERQQEVGAKMWGDIQVELAVGAGPDVDKQVREKFGQGGATPPKTRQY